MVARNNEDLRRMLMKDLRKAMKVGSEKALADMYEQTGDFYTGGEPKIYERTGALGDTPRTTEISVEGDSVSFKAYFDENHDYTTGKKPTMHDVLDLADKGITNSSVGNLRRAVGKTGFVERADQQIQKTMDDTLGSFFIKQ